MSSEFGVAEADLLCDPSVAVRIRVSGASSLSGVIDSGRRLRVDRRLLGSGHVIRSLERIALTFGGSWPMLGQQATLPTSASIGRFWSTFAERIAFESFESKPMLVMLGVAWPKFEHNTAASADFVLMLGPDRPIRNVLDPRWPVVGRSWPELGQMLGGSGRRWPDVGRTWGEQLADLTRPPLLEDPDVSLEEGDDGLRVHPRRVDGLLRRGADRIFPGDGWRFPDGALGHQLAVARRHAARRAGP